MLKVYSKGISGYRISGERSKEKEYPSEKTIFFKMDNFSKLAYINGDKTPSEKQVERIIKGVKDAAKEILELELA